MEKYVDRNFIAWLSDVRRELHRNAETGFDLFKTKQIVKRELSAMGCRVHECGKGCIFAVISGKKEGKNVLLRADMDALPIEEKADLEFACQNGSMHACGHDMHTAMLLGCAFLLMKSKDRLCGTVKLMFQGAEELLLGCKDAVENGILEDPVPDTAVFLHVMTGVSLETGTLIVSGGGICAPAAAFFKTEIFGKSAHASDAGAGVNALSIGVRAAALMESVPIILGHDSKDLTVTLGNISAGSCANVVSDRCTVLGCVRSFDEDEINKALEKIAAVSQEVSRIFGGSSVTSALGRAPTLVSNEDISKIIISELKDYFGDEKVLDGEILARKVAASGKRIHNGSEDFAIISHKIPTVMIGLCAGCVSEGYTTGLHNPETTFDEKALEVGALSYFKSCMRLLKE